MLERLNQLAKEIEQINIKMEQARGIGGGLLTIVSRLEQDKKVRQDEMIQIVKSL
jgi:hypothetical protein